MTGRLVALALLLAGCGAVEPYATQPRPPMKGPDAALPRVGVCYNALFSKPEAVRAVAEEACLKYGTPELVEQDLRLACPLAVPARATFACVPAP